MVYDFVGIEKKWQEIAEKKDLFKSDLNSKKKKFYCLEMFPYPSGEGLHMGHALNYFVGDILVRFKRMNNFNVMYPMGYDAFGLPAENAAIKAKTHPREYTSKAIKNFIKQQKMMGISYDWSKSFATCNPEYYHWNQYFFLRFLEKGLIYRKKAPVNWCNKCDTVLANEQVHDGKCWRHEDTNVEIKHLEQWFIKTTDYAEELLEMVDKLNWPERIKIMQKNWIGRSEGTEILFEINNEKWPIFTTRPDTIYGVTFMVISAQHSRLDELVTDEQKKKVEKFLKELKSVSGKDLEKMDKEGVFTGSYAINPINKEKVPIYAGNFVVADYASGMVMAVPAHDQRDFDFALKYEIKMKPVIQPVDFEIDNLRLEKAYKFPGTLINSGEFNGLDNEDAKEKITDFLIKKKIGKRIVQYKLRDWLVSRQRYWGTPIPVIYCDDCGIVPVSEKDLPIKLPEDVKFGKGNPLLSNEKFVNVKCPKCGGKAKRETDTMDTFFDSSWYYLRYLDNENSKEPFAKKKVDYWMPVDQYIGGAEHACMHLIYARFFTKALRDLGYVNFDEPFTSLFNQGMLHANDGRKMSKSLGNVINPLDIIEKYGSDTLRLSLMSFATPDKDTNWDEKVLIGSFKFVNKIHDKFQEIKIGKSDKKIENKLNKAIKEVTNQIESFKYNLAIIKVRDLFDSLKEEESKEVLIKSLKLLHPFCPHLSCELWEKIGEKGYVGLMEWPKVEESKIDENLDKQEQAIEDLASDINHVVGLVKEKNDKIVKKCFVYVLPNEKNNFIENLDLLKKKTNLEIEIFSVNDKNKYDPDNKSKKVKPGKPGIYLE